ncbi:MAG: hypothetical protein ACE5Q6_03245 [Dehalococcoidia bacterium]
MANQGDTNSSDSEIEGVVLSEQGVVDLTDQLTEYMTEVELGGLPDILGQVLDDFLDQCGSMPEDLQDPAAFEEITSNQLAVTLAYQLGRLEGRSPQIVRRLIEQAIDKWGARPLQETSNISDVDLQNPKEMVYPQLRRMEYMEPDE